MDDVKEAMQQMKKGLYNADKGKIQLPKPTDHSAQSGYGEQESGSGTGKIPPEMKSRKS